MLTFTEQHIESQSPNPAAFLAGKKLSSKEQWLNFSHSERAIWGELKGSGKSPYLAQVDTISVAYKCTCPSRQFPCKHTIALMLLQVKNASAFTLTEEPEWVKTWMDKRAIKPKESPEEPKERTEAEQEQADKNKEKTLTSRLSSVMAGAAELELWLKDLVRIGFLELVSKPQVEFEKVAARMVDAKAPGLAGWVKAFGKLQYQDQQEWQQHALVLVGKLFLLVRTLQNYENLSPLWQHTIRNLAGWSQSSKELLADADAETVKDDWLVVGQEIEVTNDDVIIQRNWLVGIDTNRSALILNFGTKFSPIENNVVPGTVVQGELAFFPSVLPQRAVLKMQRKVLTAFEKLPSGFNSFKEINEFKITQLKINPWANDLIVLIHKVRMINSNGKWFVCDDERSFIPLPLDFNFQKIMKWLVVSGNQNLTMVLVIRNDNVIPLGIFHDTIYTVL